MKDKNLAKAEEDLKRLEVLSKYAGEDKVVTLEEKRKELKDDENITWVVKTGIPTLDNTSEKYSPNLFF